MPNILIIDDDQDICLLLDNYFSKKGFDVQTASNGNSAIEILKKSAVEVVLCDFKLPDYTGIEILQKIKIINPLTQVIIITGYSDVRVAVEALKKGAFEYEVQEGYMENGEFVKTGVVQGGLNAIKNRERSVLQNVPIIGTDFNYITGGKPRQHYPSYGY